MHYDNQDLRGRGDQLTASWNATEPQPDVVDVVADASMDSFPASDPPSWSGVRVGPPMAGR